MATVAPSVVLGWLEGWISSIPVTPGAPADCYVPWHLAPDEMAASVPLDGRFALGMGSGPDRDGACFETMGVDISMVFQAGRDTRYKMVDAVRDLRSRLEEEAADAYAVATAGEMRPIIVDSIAYDYTTELGLVVVEIRCTLTYHSRAA